MAEVEDKDLTGEAGEAIGIQNIAVSPQALLPKIPLEPFNLDKKQEEVRGLIAQGLVVLLAVIILFAFISLWIFSNGFNDLEKLMSIIFSPVIALAGTATGYYLGGNSAKNGQSSTDSMK
jgi:hypothetical protein